MQQPVGTISRAVCGVIVRMHSGVETYSAGWHAYGYGLRPNRTYALINAAARSYDYAAKGAANRTYGLLHQAKVNG